MEGGKGQFLDDLGQDSTKHFMIVWSSAFQRKVQSTPTHLFTFVI